jgi:hypothetical protein
MLAGLSRGFDESGSDSGSEADSEAEGEDYKPDYGPRGKSTGKRRRGHGQLPAALAAAAGRVRGVSCICASVLHTMARRLLCVDCCIQAVFSMLIAVSRPSSLC